MKSKNKQLIEASEYIFQNPTISKTQVASIFKVDRHSIPVKDFEKYIFEKDNKCYYFTNEELKIVQYWNDNPNISFNELKRKFNQPSKIETLKDGQKYWAIQLKDIIKFNIIEMLLKTLKQKKMLIGQDSYQLTDI